MKEFQQISALKLQQMLIERNYWLRIHNNKLLYKTQASTPSKIVDGGTSKIVTYYDEHVKYLCTIHQVTTRDGQIIHENVKDALLNGIWYKATS